MRIKEAVALDREDVNLEEGIHHRSADEVRQVSTHPRCMTPPVESSLITRVKENGLFAGLPQWPSFSRNVAVV